MKYLVAICFLSFLSCNKMNEWTEKERQEFKTKCSETIIFEANPIYFTGFDFDEIDTVQVIERSNSKSVDTFYIYTDIENSLNSKEDKKYWADINKKLNIKNTYEFYLGNDKPYILDNMEMIMWSQYTMAGEGWGCQMGNFTIDNKKFEHVGNIEFRRRGYKYSWE